MGVSALWHDVECGAYRADLSLWRRLADRASGPILDVGSGTGRVALDLAQGGHEVVALDRDQEFLETLAGRAGDLDVQTVTADAREFALGRPFPLIVVPMQTVQLLGGPEGRAAFLACVRAHLAPGGVLACALVGKLVPFEPAAGVLPLPDIREIDGIVYASRPVAVRHENGRMVLERLRETVSAAGQRTIERNVVHLDLLTPRQLIAEAARHGLVPERTRRIAATDEHVASQVVILRA
jgi:SAM-dependent methyltransferase